MRIDTRLQHTRNKVAGPLGSEDCLRINTRLKQTSSMSLFPKMGNNALAGALAGMFVSLWLHPIDIVKIIIQSHIIGHSLLFHNMGSIMSKRGVSLKSKLLPVNFSFD